MKRILIAEDNDDFRTVLLHFLNRYEYEVIAAKNEEIFYLLVDAFTPDLVILDVMLHDADGRKICREVKKINKDIKAILISGSSELLKDYESYGADLAVEKPIVFSEFIAMISMLTGNTANQ